MNRRPRRAEQAKSRKMGTGYLEPMVASRPHLKPGLHHVYIAHDDWCAFLRGGHGNCTPDMHRYAHGSDVVEVIEADGLVTTVRAS
jgi:hypothetical protein